MLNLYPPLFFNRIRVTEMAPDFKSCRVEVARSLLTRNLNGSTFGGTIFSAADPVYSILYWQIFARRGIAVQVWLKGAKIRYLEPAKTALSLEFRLEDEEVETTLGVYQSEGRVERSYSTDAVDRNGVVCAEIETIVYVRPVRGVERGASGF